MDLEPYLDFIRDLAVASGEIIRPYFANPDLGLELKEDQTPVTLADRKAEAHMRAMIERRFPGHGILGEEYGASRSGAEFTWVLDPIDGTKAFAAACPVFGTLIGLLHEGRPILGCIHQPILGQLLLGDGRSATLNGRPARLRSCPRLEEATLCFGSLHAAEEHQNGSAYDALTRRVRLARGWGDCYGYLLVATGWADIALDPIMNPWDILPLLPVIEGAGGRITDWQGADAARPGASSTVAAHPSLHPSIIAALNPDL